MIIIKRIMELKITNKKILNYIEIINIIGLLLCLFSFLFTYYYFLLFQKIVLNIGFFLFEFGLSIIVGSIISGIIIDSN